MDRNKSQLRKLKRQVKRAGTKKLRRQLERDLRDNPAEAHQSEIDYRGASSATLNGLDKDATRRRPKTPE